MTQLIDTERRLGSYRAMASVEYNPNVIQKFAQRLYSRANSIVAIYALSGVIVGAVAGWLGAEALAINVQTSVLVGAGLFGLLGFAIGSERALFLRVQAQTLLCQMMIENNTAHFAQAHAGERMFEQ